MEKLEIRKLEIKNPPLNQDGGRLLLPAGELAQIVSGESFRFLAYIEFIVNEYPRGNHFHKIKHEYLYIIKGRLRAIYKDLDTNVCEEYILESGHLIHLKPNCAHVYYTMEYTQAIEFSPIPFDNSDTYKHQVIE